MDESLTPCRFPVIGSAVKFGYTVSPNTHEVVRAELRTDCGLLDVLNRDELCDSGNVMCESAGKMSIRPLLFLGGSPFYADLARLWNPVVVLYFDESAGGKLAPSIAFEQCNPVTTPDGVYVDDLVIRGKKRRLLYTATYGGYLATE